MAHRMAIVVALLAVVGIACDASSDPSTEPPDSPLQVPDAIAQDRDSQPLPPRAGGLADQVEAVRDRVRDAPAGDWLTYQGNPQRTGHAQTAPSIAKPRIRWQKQIGIQGYLNSPLVVGSKVIVPTSGKAHNRPDAKDGVHALDVRTGDALWHAESLGDANGASATLTRVVFTSDDHRVHGIDVATGKEVWTLDRKGTVYSTPLILGDTAVVGDAVGFVSGISMTTGKLLWERRYTGAIRGGLASDGTRIFVVSQGGDVAAIDVDGTELWVQAVTRPGWGGGRAVAIEGYNAPVVDGTRLIVPFARDTYYSDDEGGPAMVALSTTDGSEVWRPGKGGAGKGSWGNIRSSPALAKGVIVWAEPYSGDIAGIDSATGAPRFRKTVGACLFPQYASPAVAGDLAYVPRHDGHLNAIALPSGTLEWKFYLGDAKRTGATPTAIETLGGCEWEVPTGSPLYSPVAIAADGTVFVGSGEGFLYAIEEAG